MKKNRDLPRFASDIRDLVGKDQNDPPVESWHPDVEGEIDIRIGPDGTWYYQGEKMQRLAMVQLFSTILRREGDDYYLVTPVEKMKITVDDAPYLVNMMDVEGEGDSQVIHFSTTLGDCFSLGNEHELKVRSGNTKADVKPYVRVKRNLMGLVSRTVYYELAKIAVPANDDPDKPGVWSRGEFYSLV